MSSCARRAPSRSHPLDHCPVTDRLQVGSRVSAVALGLALLRIRVEREPVAAAEGGARAQVAQRVRSGRTVKSGTAGLLAADPPWW